MRSLMDLVTVSSGRIFDLLTTYVTKFVTATRSYVNTCYDLGITKRENSYRVYICEHVRLFRPRSSIDDPASHPPLPAPRACARNDEGKRG